MNLKYFLFLSFILLNIFTNINSFEVVTVAITATVAAASCWFYCTLRECCNSHWITDDLYGLRSDIKTKFHGQEVASQVILDAIQNYMVKEKPDKPLILSFNGWVGTGKNHVSNLIAKNLYKKGMQSKFVHYYSSIYDFSHDGELHSYKRRLEDEIFISYNKCIESLYIFDEVHLMPEGLLSSILSSFKRNFSQAPKTKDAWSLTNKPDNNFRKTIIILLSNTGSDELNRVAYEHFLKGNNRESLSMEHVQPLIDANIFQEKDLMFRQKADVDQFVPFFPLERQHVEKCIRYEMNSRGLLEDQDIIDNVLDELEWNDDLYSNSGCKKIASKLNYFY